MSRRSPLAVLAVLTLVGSLLAVSVSPASGKDGEADDLATYSACVGPATESAGFEDVPSGSVSEAAINCMAHYGIMPGTSGKFSPRLEVTRREMALFLIRAAGPAGIEIPRAADQGFDDIDGLPRAVREAINQLVDLGITQGTTGSTFSPDGIVTRRQMVQFLARFLDIAPVGEGGIYINDVDPDDDQFLDIEELPHGPYDAIRALFELGVTNGTSRTRFSPDRTVTRAQMAMFISRMLAHTNARPAGVTVQAAVTTVTADDTVDLVVSVRDEDHQPLADVLVDVFSAPTAREPFDSVGRCSSRVVAEFGDRRCVIDVSDETTDGDGNLPYTMIVEESLVLWAWTGGRGDRFDVDETSFASLKIGAGKAAVAFLLTDDMHPEARKVPFGRWVEYTFQLVDEDDNPVAEKGVELRLRSREENDNRVVRDHTRTYETDADGKVVVRFRLSDPDSRDGDPDGKLDLDVLRADVDDIIDESAVRVTEGSNRLLWSDDDDVPTSLLIEQTLAYHPATDSGRGARHRITAKLVDQYGDPVRGQRVHFVSNDPDGLSYKKGDPNSAQNAYRKTTSTRGAATVTYYRDSDDPRVETIDAFTDDVNADSLKHFWVEDAPEGRTLDDLELLHYDEDRNILVIGCRDLSIIPDSDWCRGLTSLESGLYVITFDPNDQFNKGSSTEKYDAFRDELEEGDIVTVVIVSHDEDDVNSFTR